MSDVLIVVAHPEKGSFNHALADAYEREARRYTSVRRLKPWRAEF